MGGGGGGGWGFFFNDTATTEIYTRSLHDALPIYTLLVGAFVLSATILLVYGFLWLAIAAFIVSGIAGIALLRLMLQMGRADRLP